MSKIISAPRYTLNAWLMRRKYQKRYAGKIIGMLYNKVIGPFAQFTEYYIRYCRVHSIDPHRDVVLIGSTTPVNLQLQVMFERAINIELNDDTYKCLYDGGERFLRKIRCVIPDNPEVIKNGIIYYPECPNNISFTESEIDYGWSLLEKIGIKHGEPFVTVHNKDQTYWLEERGQSKPWDSYRDTNFDDLIPTISYLLNLGYHVIRAGHYMDTSDIFYKSLMGFSKKEKAFLDIFIQRYCRFAVCGGSGIAMIPWLFKTNILYHNFIPMEESPIVEHGLIIPKLLKSRRKNRLLTISEIRNVTYPLVYFERGQIKYIRKRADGFQGQHYYDEKRIDIIDNTPEEVLKGVEEIELYVSGELHLTEKQQRLQHSFKTLFPPHHPMRHMGGIVSPSFLEKYQEILR